jgi:hypothetical protein
MEKRRFSVFFFVYQLLTFIGTRILHLFSHVLESCNNYKTLLENGANIHVKKDAPLVIASAYGSLQAVELLLANGAKMTMRVTRGSLLIGRIGH